MNTEELSTEDKILIAASKVFTEKGFSGTRTRDIAEEAGINLALLNYYFRTKEKLFEQVMKVKIVLLFGQIIPIVTNEKTSLDEKIDLASVKYFEILSKNPNLPIFVLSEIQKKTSDVKSILPFEKVLNNSYLMKQIKERKPDVNPFHFLLNFLSMTVFPFLGKPILQSFDLMNDEEFQKFVEERKTMVPMWIKMMLNN
ncbi:MULTISPECIES: TetR/AcrR family transcriptional regulator [unclassified Kaistella]|uniref:TetR/AcrR family transcriptional regulator n=1 Tax=unclassified Kaistella TaxID=2762626 RepID=UPI002734376D|nr:MULTISPECIES: TetR/AcrR family transcriptional regulator [unclassified Kaistella]MCZ2085500.1 TetR/AcrR family transcriptional regulator [Flavobacteriales bacterium]MDP2453522.1 TetR family transcriptional regulator [Kaistella sp. SH11-4b]MDP2456579.1 TetR family transcriptional regulator [Kaistella sp. SH40-3]MDP2459335.1 TetR family transcriptional regulator [Kaistella sp. SH19-2b]